MMRIQLNYSLAAMHAQSMDNVEARKLGDYVTISFDLVEPEIIDKDYSSSIYGDMDDRNYKRLNEVAALEFAAILFESTRHNKRMT